MTTGPAALVVDAVGLRCPMPVLELARRLAAAEVARGAVVHLLSDDPAAATDVPAWCRMRGHTYVGAEQEGTVVPATGITTYVLRIGSVPDGA